MAHADIGGFDALLAEMERDPKAARQLRAGRKWVGKTFYDPAPTLASLRLAAGLSQRQLGQACGLEQSHVSRYESGRLEPGLVTARAMAQALQVDLDSYFVAWTNARAAVAPAIP